MAVGAGSEKGRFRSQSWAITFRFSGQRSNSMGLLKASPNPGLPNHFLKVRLSRGLSWEERSCGCDEPSLTPSHLALGFGQAFKPGQILPLN